MKSSFKRHEFAYAKRGKCWVGRTIIINVLQVKGPTKLGITVTRRFGKAHERNRFKRLVREAFRHSSFPSNYLVHIRPRVSDFPISLQQLQKEIQVVISAQCELLVECNQESVQSQPSFQSALN